MQLSYRNTCHLGKTVDCPVSGYVFPHTLPKRIEYVARLTFPRRFLRPDSPLYAECDGPRERRHEQMRPIRNRLLAAEDVHKLDGKPLVSIVPCGMSRVIYVHCDFGGTEERSDETLIVRAIMEYLGRKSVAICDNGNYAAMGFRLGERRLAYIIHNNVASYDVIDDKGRTWWSFQTDDPRTTGDSLRCRVPGKKGAAWNVTDMTDGSQSKLVADSDGYVTISMDKRNIRGVILSPAE